MKKVIGLLFCGVSVLSLGVSELKADSCGIPPNFKCSCAKPVANIVNGKISISCGKTYCPQGRVCTDTGDCCPEITDCESVNGVTCKCDVCEDGTTKNSTEDKCCPIIANCSTYDANCGCQTCADGYDLKDGNCESGDICASYSCGTDKKAVPNYNSAGEIIGCTCCDNYDKETDTCTGNVALIAEVCQYASSKYSEAAINGSCCYLEENSYEYTLDYDEDIGGSYTNSTTREIMNGSKGLRCVRTQYSYSGESSNWDWKTEWIECSGNYDGSVCTSYLDDSYHKEVCDDSGCKDYTCNEGFSSCEEN